MPYPVPNYADATIPMVVDVAPNMLPVLANMARAGGAYNVPLLSPPNAEVQKWMLGLAIRQGIGLIGSTTMVVSFVDRFNARFPTCTPTDALLFADDVLAATALATASSKPLAEVYRTCAHLYLVSASNDFDRFFVPSF
jgi:hypothetical protein